MNLDLQDKSEKLNFQQRSEHRVKRSSPVNSSESPLDRALLLMRPFRVWEHRILGLKQLCWGVTELAEEQPLLAVAWARLEGIDLILIRYWWEVRLFFITGTRWRAPALKLVRITITWITIRTVLSTGLMYPVVGVAFLPISVWCNTVVLCRITAVRASLKGLSCWLFMCILLGR